MSDIKLKQNYFELFGLPKTFKLDVNKLEESHRALQMQYHPDRTKGQAESAQMATRINDGYKALKSPLLRAEYLLLLEGIAVNSDKPTYPPTEDMLIEAMEWRELLSEAGDAEALIELEEDGKDRVEELLEYMEEQFASNKLEFAAIAAMRLRYMHKWQEELLAVKRRKVLS